MKSRIILSLLVIIVLASGCAKDTITAKAVDDLPIEKRIEIEAKVTSVEECMNVACGSNSRCIDGDCVCNEGYKDCNGECILEKDCCTEDDCETDESCRDHMCIPDNCGVNEEFDTAKQKCDCDEDSVYCAAQRKCIPKDNCCTHAGCDSDYRCVPTDRFVVLCIDSGKKQCRSVHTGRTESFFMEGVRYDVEINKFLQNDGVDIDVNGVNHLIAKDEIEDIAETVSMYIDDIEDVGGGCKRDF